MRKTILATLTAALMTPAIGQSMYQCEDENGRKIFSQLPCSPSAESLEVDYQKLTPEQIEAAEARAKAEAEGAEAAMEASGQRLRESEISESEARIRRLQRERDAKMAANRAKAKRANNNLAGATWEQALAMENQAVAEQYNADIAAERARLQSLRAQ